jgi:peptide/nickel transport system substrate-binding protein/oligopeptide transport system substrate-binding protein
MWGLDNRMGWQNKEFNDLIAKANKTADQQQAIALYNQAEDIAIQEMPMIPLWTWAGQGGRSKNVDNVTITPFSTGLVATDVTVK